MIYLASRQVHKHMRIEFLKEILKKERIEYYHFIDDDKKSLKKQLSNLIKSKTIYVLPCNWPILTVLFGKLLGKRIVTEFYFSWYDASVNDWKKYDKNSFKAKILKMIDWIIMKLADKVIFLNETEAKRYMKMILGRDRNYEIIPLSVEERKKVELNYFRNKSEKFNIVWYGGYIPLHGLEKIIRAMEILQRIDKKYQLYILGNIEERSLKYKELIKNLNLKNCDITNDMTFLNGKLEPFLIEKCDLVLGGFGDSSKINEVITHKMLDIFSMKGICLTAHSKAIDEYFKENESVFYCEKTPESIAKKIVEISKKELREIEKISEKSYEIYKKYFVKEYYQRKIIEILILKK